MFPQGDLIKTKKYLTKRQNTSLFYISFLHVYHIDIHE